MSFNMMIPPATKTKPSYATDKGPVIMKNGVRDTVKKSRQDTESIKNSRLGNIPNDV
jgi:hypothetical protein